MIEENDVAEIQLLKGIASGDENAFRHLFFDYYDPLCRFAFRYTRSGELARDAVQEVFFRLWKNRGGLKISTSLNAYLYRAVRNQALNLMQLEETQSRLAEELRVVGLHSSSARVDEAVDPGPGGGHADPLLHVSERVRLIWTVIEKMPCQQRTVFELHRKHGLSYKEIAQVMNIARKTVENHMGRAMKYLREHLSEDRLVDQK